MIKNLIKTSALALFLSVSLSSCDNDNGAGDPGQDVIVITFDDTNILHAAPSSYGENLYADYTGDKFTKASIAIPGHNGVTLDFGINTAADGTVNFWNGGAVLSSWNYRSDIDGKSENWWYSFSNQCSVYNTLSTDGANKGAGADRSNSFLVINGYKAFDSCAELTFSGRNEFEVSNILFCPTSYLYGSITNPNPFGSTPDKSLVDAGGWFKMLAYGFDANDAPTNGGKPVEIYICDYRPDTYNKVAIPTTWTNWNISALGRVNKIRFDFEGSDSGAYGLNTPAYMALDNLTILAD